MQRRSLTPRANWQAAVEELGLIWHSDADGPYWDESACYAFSMAEIETIEAATEEVHRLYRAAGERIANDAGLLSLCGIPASFHDVVRSAWQRQVPALDYEELLARLNKRVTTADFVAAAEWLRMQGMALRAFVLLRPPFLTEEEGLEWAKRTIDVAIDNGATFTALIPVRGGNGAMDVLRAAGDWAPPSLASLEAGLRHGLSIAEKLPHQRVTADVWDISLFSDAGDADSAAIIERVSRMNIEQKC